MNPMMVMGLISALGSMYAAHQGGSDAKQGSTYSPEAQGGLNEALQEVQKMRSGADIRENPAYMQGMEYFNSMFNDPKFFEKFEAPMMRQFEEETIPGVANRFAAQGTGGSLGSTGFRNQLGREASNLQTNIAQMRGNMQANAIPQMLGYANQPFQNYQSLLGTATQPTQNQYQPANAGGLAQIMAALSGSMMQGYGSQGGGGGQSNPSVNAGQHPSTG